ncbi:MAG TPA: septum formation initiator family protein [Oligoflexia bacterium]|nr:septum formation initiator family protein [Oligoflexia bacterium]HMR24982.1 septum formation initiator family protein [Oligoflexia bacterium]
MPGNLKVRIKKIWIKLNFQNRWLSYTMASYIFILFVAALFGDQGLLKSYRLWQKKQILEQENHKIDSEIKDLSQKIYYFRDDLRTIEKYAREELKFSGNDEVRFVFKD